MEEIKSADWNKVFEIYMKENDAQEKLRLLNGLASTSNLKLLKKYVFVKYTIYINNMLTYFKIISACWLKQKMKRL